MVCKWFKIQRSNDKNKQHNICKVIRKSSATAAIKEADSFLVFNYTLRYDANGRLLNDEGKLDKNYFPVFYKILVIHLMLNHLKTSKSNQVGPSEDGRKQLYRCCN